MCTHMTASVNNIMCSMQGLKVTYPVPLCEDCGRDAQKMDLAMTCYKCLWHRCYVCAFHKTAETDCCRRLFCLEHIRVCAFCQKYACAECADSRMIQCSCSNAKCGKYACTNHAATCDSCNSEICRPCGKVCERCLRIFCASCRTKCLNENNCTLCAQEALNFGALN